MLGSREGAAPCPCCPSGSPGGSQCSNVPWLLHRQVLLQQHPQVLLCPLCWLPPAFAGARGCFFPRSLGWSSSHSFSPLKPIPATCGTKHLSHCIPGHCVRINHPFVSLVDPGWESPREGSEHSSFPGYIWFLRALSFPSLSSSKDRDAFVALWDTWGLSLPRAALPGWSLRLEAELASVVDLITHEWFEGCKGNPVGGTGPGGSPGGALQDCGTQGGI